MSSQKLLSRGTVLNLFSKSLNGGRKPQICHTCGLTSCLAASSSIILQQHQHQTIDTEITTKNNQGKSRLEQPQPQPQPQRKHQARLSYRPSCSLASGTAAASSPRSASLSSTLAPAPALNETGSYSNNHSIKHQISSQEESAVNFMHHQGAYPATTLTLTTASTTTITSRNTKQQTPQQQKPNFQVNNKIKEVNHYEHYLAALLSKQQQQHHHHNSMLINSGQNYQQFRCSSTTSATNQLAQEILVKRDASTQAATRQQRLNPNYDPHHDDLIDENDNYLKTGHERRDTFTSDELRILPCAPSEMAPKPPVESLMFGKCFTDHMFRVDWDEECGWQRPLISKVHDLKLHPAAKVFHYGLGAFEGAKAYRGHDDKIRFFRLDQNIRRLAQSTRRLALPDFDQHEMIKCIHKLVELDQDWIPQIDERAPTKQLTSLYLRPMIMGVEPSLGVACSKKAILSVLLSPVGPYFKTGFKPVSLYADPAVVRAWPGGAGSSKLGSNYAPTIYPQRQAEQLGHQQVLWLFGEDEKLTEVGTMNIFVTIKNETTGKIHLITPPLNDGLILPGITRQSILELASQWPDIQCEERYLTISDIQELISKEHLLEMFGSGTACIVCPISSISLKDGRQVTIPSHNLEETSPAHAITQRILTAITDIQYGKVAHPWAQELGSYRY